MKWKMLCLVICLVSAFGDHALTESKIFASIDRTKVSLNDDRSRIEDLGAVLKQPNISYATCDVVNLDFKSSNPNHGVK